MVVVCLYLCLCLCLCLASSTPTAKVGEVKFDDLVRGGSGPVLALRKALVEDGIVAISGIKGVDALRERVLGDSARCVPASEDAVASTLGDGTVRQSLGWKTVLGVVAEEEWDGNDGNCAAFAKNVLRVRKEMHRAVQIVVGHLDDVCRGKDSPSFAVERSSGPAYTSIASLIPQGDVLEHLHLYTGSPDSVYTGTEQSTSEQASLEMHTDNGLFIAFLPGMVLDHSSSIDDDGFRVELSNGRVVRPLFPLESGNVTVLMVGDAFERLINVQAKFPFRAVPHRLKVPTGINGGAKRAWFGRMYLPPDDTIFALEAKTFGELRVSSVLSQSNPGQHGTLGCSSMGGLAEDLSGGACKAGLAYCWMQCVKAPACSQGQVAECVHPDLSVWVPSQGMCPSCKMQCVNNNPKPPPPSSQHKGSFCNGYPAAMYMGGFIGAGHEGEACLVLLTSAWILDTEEKFALSLVGVVAFGVLVEYILKCRRSLHGYAKERGDEYRRSTTFVLLHTCLFMVQVSLGYVAMLFAMTYSTWVFLATVLGLGLGHAIFNVQQPIQEFADPCCQAFEEDDSGEENDNSNEAPLLTNQ